jgi:hypothetical protein
MMSSNQCPIVYFFIFVFLFCRENAFIHSNPATKVKLVNSNLKLQHVELAYLGDDRGRRLSTIDSTLLQRCKDGGEAYSASYLIHKEHLLYQHTAYNLTWVNCEMGSFIMMNGRANPSKDVNGSIMQSIDVLDLSVIHLSAYERLLLRWARSTPQVNLDKNNISTVIHSSHILETLALKFRRKDTLHSNILPSESKLFHRTVVIMPYLGVDKGAGHSKLYNRQIYLSACFWSFYMYFPYVVAGVKSEKDRHFILNTSKLPFYDVMLLDNLPKSASLPVATVQETKRRISNGNWDFDYVFFTESDQILMMRIADELYNYLDGHRRHLIIPHRLMAYPSSVLQYHHKRAQITPSIASTSNSQYFNTSPLDWFDIRCLLPLQHCTDRKNWIHVSNESLPVINIYGIDVPLGNSDFHRESYRACRIDFDH